MLSSACGEYSSKVNPVPDPVGRLRDLPAKGHGHPPDRLAGRDASIQRDHDVDGMAKPYQRAWERGNDVREAAGLRERCGLGRDHQNPHRRLHTSTPRAGLRRQASGLGASGPPC